jgi:hypothetical protein
MSNVRPLHQVAPVRAPGELITTMQATDRRTGECFSWHSDSPLMIQVFDGWQAFISGVRSDLLLPFNAINPVSGIPAWHDYVASVRRFQNRSQ